MAPPISNSPGWVEAIKIALQRGVREELHTCLPGRIESYDKDTQLADVRICVKQRLTKDTGVVEYQEFIGTNEIPGLVPGVRVEFNQSADFFMSFPLAAGDFVWLHIVERSVDAWFTNGGVGVEDPIDRHHDLSDCWAVPARDPSAPLTNTENDAVVIGHKTSGPRAYFTSSIIGLGAKAPSNFVGDGTKTMQQLADLKTAINGWTVVPNDGGAALKTALTAWLSSSSDVRLTKVKGV